MAEAAQAQVDLAQSVEEQQSRPDHRMLELALAVPRHLVERAVEERVDVVAVAGPARVFERREAAADSVAALEADRLEPGAPEVSLEDEAVVPRPQQNAVVRLQSPLMGVI